MISRLGATISRLFRLVCPDPFILAIGLTVVTGILALLLTSKTVDGVETGHSIGDLVGYWQGGFWSLLTFSMQMCLILVTGHALASSPPIAALIRRIAAIPKSGRSATMLVAGIAMMLGTLNWGLGLVAGALLARDVGKSLKARGIPHHYPLLAAAGYLGLLVWHGGFSGSAPLKATSQTGIDEVFAGLDLDVAPIPLTETVFSPMNLIITGGAIIIGIVVIALLVPRDDTESRSIDQFDVPQTPALTPTRRETVPDWLESTPWFSIMLAVPMLIWLADLLMIGDNWPMIPDPEDAAPRSWKNLTPNEVNLLFLALGLLCHGTPRRYLHAVNDAVRGCSGIILQFPLYAGIMGMMKTSGLTAELAEQIARFSNDTTLPVMTFLSAGIVNLFVPSGGGQWAVQGPIAMQAASEMGVEYPRMVMAVAYGDQLTNMLQPFWALPLLGITGVKARDLVGYTCIVMVAAGGWMALGLLLF